MAPPILLQGNKATLIILFCTASALSGAMGALPLAWWPDWLAAVVALGALLGALLMYRTAGALRTGFLVAFITALAVAAVTGWWLAGTPVTT